MSIHGRHGPGPQAPRAALPADRRAHRHRMIGVPTLLLDTTGARSGKTRTNALVYARDGEDYLLVASNGGSDRPPAWLHNLPCTPGRRDSDRSGERRTGAARYPQLDQPRLRPSVEDRQRQQPLPLHRLPEADDPDDSYRPRHAQLSRGRRYARRSFELRLRQPSQPRLTRQQPAASMAAARAMKRGNPVEHRGAVISDPPLLRQLRHRMQLILDHTQVADIDRVSGTDTSRRQTPNESSDEQSQGSYPADRRPQRQSTRRRWYARHRTLCCAERRGRAVLHVAS